MATARSARPTTLATAEGREKANSAPQPSARVRVIIVADVRLYRDGLVEALRPYPVLDVIGAASGITDAFSLIRGTSPDVAVIDMAIRGAFDLLRKLRSDTPRTQAVAFAIDENISTIIECAEAGAAGYVTVNASIDDLAHAVTRTAAGELLCTPKVAAELFRRIADPPDTGATTQESGTLTVREREVLALLRPGLSNKAIASALNISQATVKNHVHHVLDKLKVGSRHQAAAHAADVASRKRRAHSRG
jgi:two-component system, NarL family, nitrate/nitrite response regulator NarL